MAKELMWVCALLPKEVNQQLVQICREANAAIGLPENVFRFPLHISMKKSFQTTSFDAVKAAILAHLREYGPICCKAGGVVCHRKMLWLPIEPTGSIKEWHDTLDAMLLSRFGIPIDRFDAAFSPHISLFTKGEQAQISEMQKRLQQKIAPMELSLNRFVIGSSGHKDAFFEIG
jgi:hypothetical protein